jgi:threonine synthase
VDEPDLRCSVCDAVAGPLDWNCKACGGVLDVDAEHLRGTRRSTALLGEPAQGVWRYLPWLPVSEVLSLGEPTTPLVRARVGDARVTLKLEGALPTGSFKDRGSALMVRWLVTHGASEVVVDSSGNAGASLAAYSASAGLTCHVFAPRASARAKLAQIAAYGAVLHEVDGNREDVTNAAISWAADGFYASHCWNPMFVAGIETFAFEVWEQYGHDVPDAVVLPVGAGTLLLGAARGFAALHACGLATRVPKIFGVQSTACAPLVTAWAAGSPEPAEVSLAPTLAQGICTRRPPRGRQIIEAVTASGGMLVAVDDDALRRSHEELAAQGVFAEYTSAVATAALARLFEGGHLGRSDRVLVPISATGLKTSGT